MGMMDGSFGRGDMYDIANHTSGGLLPHPVTDEKEGRPRPPPSPGQTGLRLPVRATASSRSVHPSHATAAGHRGHLLLLLLLHHHALGGEEQSRDGRGVLQRRAGDLGRVDDAGRDQILVLVGLGVVAVVQLGRLLHLPHDDRALRTRVLNDDPDRLLERAADDLDPGLLVVIGAPDLVERLLAPQERHAAARHDALLDRGAGRVQRVLDSGLLLLHLDLGGRADIDHCDPARQLREPLLQLLLVVIRRGLLDRGLDLADAALDVRLHRPDRSEEHTSELQSQSNLVCRLLLEKKKPYNYRKSRSRHLADHRPPAFTGDGRPSGPPPSLSLLHSSSSLQNSSRLSTYQYTYTHGH